MNQPTRRSVLRASLAMAAAGSLAQPYIANAQAKTATVWWVQGFAPQEDVAFKKLCADYEKASGNKLDYSIVPFAPLRQKFITAITSGVVPDLANPAFLPYVPAQAWADKLEDVSDIIEPHKSAMVEAALADVYCYNNTTKKRSYYALPTAGALTPFHIWGSLVEKAGYKTSDIPNKWSAFLDFFKPMQKKLQAQGMRHTYSYGFVVGTVGGDPINTQEHFTVAYGGKDTVTKDGKLNSKDPKVREAAARAMDTLATLYKQGYNPPSSINWNDADDNNAFHSKLCVVDFDGTLSTEIAMLSSDPEGLKEVITHALPLDDEGKVIPAFLDAFNVAVIPKGAKNLAVAKDFAKYFMQPEVENEWVKGGVGRAVPVYPQQALSDPWWTKTGPANVLPHLLPMIEQGFKRPTLPRWFSYNPAWADVSDEHIFQRALVDVAQGHATVKEAVDKAFAQAEAIFAKYPMAS
ncbi:MAG TPA: ABC transporter substrate-binding protein [Stellaceae bacterium]|nr:ABC transporter substrate-binding protein [Stellaceae bacterium]